MTSEYLQEDAACPDAYEKSVFTQMVRAGHRTYFIDIKQTRCGKYYMSITELRRRTTSSGVTNERSKVHIYEEDFAKFADGLNEAFNFVNGAIDDSLHK